MGTAHHLTTTTAALTALLVAGCHTATNTPGTTNSPDSAVDMATVREQLAALPIRAEDTGAHNNRDQWGDWTTHPGGCTTRATVLQHQGSHVTTTAKCRITAGTWTSPYDGTTLTDPTTVQIDHRVPVNEAARSGARTWDRTLRERFYNDTTNLIAVSVHANTAKGDSDPGTWKPTNHNAWCAYATGYITTKHTYHLAVDQREHDALATMLGTCPEVAR